MDEAKGIFRMLGARRWLCRIDGYYDMVRNRVAYIKINV